MSIPPISTTHTSFSHSFQSPEGFSDFKNAMNDLDNNLPQIQWLYKEGKQNSPEMETLRNNIMQEAEMIQLSYQQPRIKDFIKQNTTPDNFAYLDSHIDSIVKNAETIVINIPYAKSFDDLSKIVNTTDAQCGWINIYVLGPINSR